LLEGGLSGATGGAALVLSGPRGCGKEAKRGGWEGACKALRECRAEIYDVLERDSFPRFVRSDEFAEWVGEMVQSAETLTMETRPRQSVKRFIMKASHAMGLRRISSAFGLERSRGASDFG
jgi:hypothetical protein